MLPQAKKRYATAVARETQKCLQLAKPEADSSLPLSTGFREESGFAEGKEALCEGRRS